MDKKEFMGRLDEVLHVCRTNDVTTEAEDGVLAAARKMLAGLPEPAFAAQAEAEPEQKRYEQAEGPADKLDLYAVEVEWDYLKAIGVWARSEEDACEIADELDRLGIVGPDPNCRIEGEAAKIVDKDQLGEGCPTYSAARCKRPEPEPKTEQDRFEDRLLGYDPLEECSRIAGIPLTWHSVRQIWEQYERTRVASELAYRVVNSDEGYHERYAMIGRDICIGRVSPTEWFGRTFRAYWGMPQFGEDFGEEAVQAWKDSLPAEPHEDAQGGCQPNN